MVDFKKELFKWGPIDGSVILMSYPMWSMLEYEKEKYGYCWPESYAIFIDKKVTWVGSMDDLMTVGEVFTNKYIMDDLAKDEFISDWKKSTKIMKDAFARIDKTNLIELSDEELKDLYVEISEKYHGFWIPAGTLEFINYALDKWLQAELKKKKIADQNEFNHAVATLSAPIELTFYRQEEKDIIEIIKLPEDEREAALEEHAKKYYWIFNSYYASQIMSKEYFKEEMEKLAKEDYEQMYNDIVNYKEQSQKEKQELIKKYSLDDNTQKIIILLEEFTIWQDIRKMDNFIGDHYVDVLLKEIVRRKNIPFDDLRCLTFGEIIEWLSSNGYKKYMDLIASRKDGLTIFHFDYMNGHTGRVLSSTEAKKVVEGLEAANADKQASVFQGVVANMGKSKYFRGTVRVVMSSKDIGKIEKGEILVTSMTAPDYVVGMKKAGAVITDEGGITCHAAIVSREIGIPCIVGTKVATRILKDGDTVEIHGGKGIIKTTKLRK